MTLLTAGECLVSPTYGPAAYHGIDKGRPIAVDQAADGAGVAPRPGAPPLDAGKMIPLSVHEIRKGVPEIIEKWRAAFGS